MEDLNGCLGTGAKETDYLLTGEMINQLPKLEEQDQKIFEYNQGKSNDCTIYSALGALSDLRNRELTPEQIEETNEESYKQGRTRGDGWYTQSAVNLACDMRMKRYPNEKVAYYRVNNYNDEEIKKIIEKNYSLCTSFNGNGYYQLDRIENGQIDNTEFGPSTYGHAVCLIGREGDKFVKDNYKGRRENGYYTNIYKVVPEISELRKSNCWQHFSYVIVKVEDNSEEDIKRLNEMKNMIDRMIEDNSAMFNLTNDIKYQEELHRMNEMNRKKKKDIENELARYFK